MNNERRKQLEKAISALEDVEALFSSVLQEESIAYSSIPPQREESADAQLSREVIETLEQVIGDMDDIQPIKITEKRRIDGAVSLLNAWVVYVKYSEDYAYLVG